MFDSFYQTATVIGNVSSTVGISQNCLSKVNFWGKC